MQLFLLQVNMLSMRQKHLNLFVQILETIFIPISAIESMYLLHSFLSPIIIGIKSEIHRKPSSTILTWMQEHAAAHMFLRELNYFETKIDGSKKLWFDPKIWYKEGKEIDQNFVTHPT